ncbi:MAG: hypothetical protein HKN42_02955, partial [Granulosicoccus sp.]|nr:hypothetical protein [Granulosicoccus sp.]
EQEGVPLLAAQSPSSNAVELTPRAEVPFRTVDTVSEEPGASILQATDTDGSMTAEREYTGPLVGSIRTSRDIDAGFHEPPATRADASNLPFQVRRQSVEVSPMSTAVAAAASASGSASDSVAAAVTLTASATNAATATVTTSTTVLATPVSMASAEVSADLPPSTRGADGSSIPVDRTAAGLAAGKLPTPSGEEVSAMELAWAQNKSALTSGTRPVTQGLSDTPTSKLLNQDGELQLGKLAALDTRSVQDKPAGNATSGTLHNAVAQAVGNALQSPDERQARGKAAALPMSGQAMNLLPADKTLQSDALVSAESPDNMFHLTTSGTVTAAQRVRGDSRAAELASAPHSVSILAPDAEEALSGNVKWMVNDGVKNALINVNPSGMGPITVKLDIDKEQMNVSIIASQGSTREALDVLLPRLREQLGAQGFDSVRVDVSDGRSDGSKGNSHQQPSQGRSDFGGMEHSGTKGEGDRNSADTLMQESELASESSEPALTLSMNEARGGHDRTRSGAALFDAYV